MIIKQIQLREQKRRVPFIDKLKAIENTIEFFLQLFFYTCSTPAPSLRLSTFDLITLDKLFGNLIILSDVVKLINELNLEALAL